MAVMDGCWARGSVRGGASVERALADGSAELGLWRDGRREGCIRLLPHAFFCVREAHGEIRRRMGVC